MLDQFGLEKFEADADRAEFFPLEKLCVAIGRNVGRGFCSGVDGIWIRWRNHQGDYSGLREVRQFRTGASL
jgi:hypothetical protein